MIDKVPVNLVRQLDYAGDVSFGEEIRDGFCMCFIYDMGKKIRAIFDETNGAIYAVEFALIDIATVLDIVKNFRAS